MNNTFALLDKDFLKKLDEHHNKVIYVRLVSLNWDEEPIAEIQGNIQSGSINVDGSSKVRRTCNLTLVTNTVQIDEVAWSLRTKFYVYLGVKNTIDPNYEDIIWFPQGMYVISSFSSSYGAQGYTITISGKDKMCLINGDVGGALFAAHEFSIIYTEHADGTITKDYIPIYDIIKEALHTYAQEPYRNIIINDLNTCGVELLDYIGEDISMYIYNQRYGDDGVVTTQISFGTENSVLAACFDDQILHNGGVSYNLPEISSKEYPQLSPGIYYSLLKRVNPTDVNTTAGYRATDITYTGELTVAIGGTITEMLDKIIQMLGEFEYFYDINGRFIFQRKRIYFNSSWSNAVVDEDQTYYNGAAMSTSSIYDFASSYLIESFQNKPQLNSIKNDFAVWGHLTTVNNKKLPIHLRYAIDRKPRIYYSLLSGKAYYSTLLNNVKMPDGSIVTVGHYDWRELIYQMAKDNLAAKSRIYGLQASLITLSSLRQAELNYADDPSETNKTLLDDWTAHAMYHYDYQRLNRADYADYYKYDLSKKKFKQLTTAVEFDACKLYNEFLYGPDISKRKIQYSQSQYQEIADELGYDPQLFKYLEFKLTDDPSYEYGVRFSKYIDMKEQNILEQLTRDDQEWLDMQENSVSLYYPDGLVEIFDLAPVINPKYYESVALQLASAFGIELNTELDGDQLAQKRVLYDGTSLQVEVWIRNSIALKEFYPLAYSVCQTIKELKVSDIPKRDYAKELALQKKYQEINYLTLAQAELDAWQDTFNTGYDAYYADMLAFWPQLYRTEQTVKIIYNEDGTVNTDSAGNLQSSDDTVSNYNDWVLNGYWNPDYVHWEQTSTGNDLISFVEPESLFFWIDFNDQDGSNPELFKYAVDVIGRRAKSINDDKVRCIYLRETPGILFTSDEWPSVAGEENLGYTRINVAPPVSDYFRISAQGKSAKEELDSLLYSCTYFQESITFSSIPIYYLEPNTRITVRDDQSGINGEYLIKSFSLQLQHDGMMSVTATRAVDRII